MRGSSVFRNGSRLAAGRERGVEELARDLADQQSRVSEALEAFAENTLRHLREETALLSDGVQMPQLKTRFRDRHALVVARSAETKRDLSIVAPYIGDFKPVLIGVDGGADALSGGRLQARRDRRRHGLGHRQDAALRAPSSSSTPTRTAARRGATASTGWGFPRRSCRRPGISEDAAMLLAYEKGAELIVAVGTRFNLIEFLERNRAGMSSTFLTRLKVGEKLVDARGVSRLFRPRVGVGMVIAFVLAALAALTAVLIASPELRDLVGTLVERLRSLVGIE